MATKTVKAPLNGVHTAGIYADMTIDGPEIGTLVVIVDRAKNLPNRKAMGKQDPYCAARLGKEAKKTETDKRGGQTPRWDQELRFTVHDSPDYYQLKVSVFNDDKKTELIGECWVPLDKILVQGGGQNDIWHNLTCKGRYAGEIRIELTYYDTRPREEKAEERRQPSQAESLPDTGRDGIGGPRQPKPVKRRPLPPDPTGLTRPAPLAQIPPSQQDADPHIQRQHYPDPIAQSSLSTPPQGTANVSTHSRSFQGSQSPSHPQHYFEYDDVPPFHTDTSRGTRSREASLDPDLEHEVEPFAAASPYDYDQAYHNDQQYVVISNSNADEEYGDRYQSIQDISPNAPQVSGPSTPRDMPYQTSHSPKVVPPYHRYSLSQSMTADVSPLQSSVRHHSQDQSSHEQGSARYCEEPPPPPPVHRMSPAASPSPISLYSTPQTYSQVPAPTPINLRNHRESVPGSPLSQVQMPQSEDGYSVTESPQASYQAARPQHPVSSQAPYNELRRHRSCSPVRDQAQPMPPSLIPGYEPNVAASETERMLRERQVNSQQRYAAQQLSPLQQISPLQPQSRGTTFARNANLAHDRRAHHTSVPVIKPTTVIPATRGPLRKSVSPQPDAIPTERRHSELPFSPDSFNAFNPTVETARAVNGLGARYSTPEQAREVSIQHERDIKRGDGPIIGNDGRIIDPSDHLPTDTWAPEPEPKVLRKGPEVKLRFRHSLQGAQPMSQASRRPLVETRPNMMPSPEHSYSAGNSPVSTPTARLKKQSRMGAAQANSSPIVPTLDTASPRQMMPRASASDYQLKEHNHHTYARDSPIHVHQSPSAVPPPVPGKVPIASEHEDWDNRALSEEMSRIDIGVGDGYGSRARRYGF